MFVMTGTGNMIFSEPNQVVYVPKTNQTISTSLSMSSSICGICGVQKQTLPTFYSGDWAAKLLLTYQTYTQTLTFNKIHA